MAVGIIVEYNPFHNGHIRQIKWIKNKFPNEKIIVVMSDKFTQRGELAVASFSKRARIAKKYGVDKVLKLSFNETAQAAHIFAHNAVMKLYKKGKIDKLVFGSESNNVELMITVAKGLKEKEKEFYQLVKTLQKKEKISFPKASSMAINILFGHNFVMPNDILAFEYIKTIINNNLPIIPYSIERNVGFHSDQTNDIYASASLLRKMIFERNDISNFSPMKFKRTPKSVASLYKTFQTKVLNNKEKIKDFPVVSEGIENLIIKNIEQPDYDSFVEKCTSKRYTSSRIKRIIAWVLHEL
ncbi:nucleotidyltransferase [Mycoplasmopsis agalactiae]|uniref:nucleotidyltransferase n=1 Tax=Mycoplasmopsis agalactiae TaxID=2110 RepID=UPI001F91BB84|nr:nucleotidyltransferase [Mycoplasmopsis agalactiae]MCE6115320.1 nucleotidyltransferase [Mycoplasmopsis agalactiae]